jgi:hypothetical protein
LKFLGNQQNINKPGDIGASLDDQIIKGILRGVVVSDGCDKEHPPFGRTKTAADFAVSPDNSSRLSWMVADKFWLHRDTGTDRSDLK